GGGAPPDSRCSRAGKARRARANNYSAGTRTPIRVRGYAPVPVCPPPTGSPEPRFYVPTEASQAGRRRFDRGRPLSLTKGPDSSGFFLFAARSGAVAAAIFQSRKCPRVGGVALGGYVAF